MQFIGIVLDKQTIFVLVIDYSRFVYLCEFVYLCIVRQHNIVRSLDIILLNISNVSLRNCGRNVELNCDNIGCGLKVCWCLLWQHAVTPTATFVTCPRATPASPVTSWTPADSAKVRTCMSPAALTCSLLCPP